MNFPIVGVGTSLSPRPSTFMTIFEIKFSIASESIGLFRVAIRIDFDIFSLSNVSLFPFPLITVNSWN